MFIRASSSIAVLLLIAFVCASARADSWALPQKKKYYSADKKYCLEVIPKQLESQLAYFKDKSEGRGDAGAAKDVKDNRAKAVFYVRDGSAGVGGGRNENGYLKKAEFPLVNEVSPVNALVSADGNYVVTFDNWHSVGYGDDVVVIYKSDGTLVAKFGLADLFTQTDIQSFLHSVSSIWWGSGHYIDETKGVLHLKAGPENAPRKSTIELATGRLVDPPPRSLPDGQVNRQADMAEVVRQMQQQIDAPSQSTVEIELADPPDKPVPGAVKCTTPDAKFDTTDALRISSQELRAKAKSLPRPPYPPIARAKHLEGRVVVEVLVSKTGDVICARTLEGDPLLLDVALLAAKFWKFESFETGENVAKVVATIALRFKLQ
jgi:TonB family protein